MSRGINKRETEIEVHFYYTLIQRKNVAIIYKNVQGFYVWYL